MKVHDFLVGPIWLALNVLLVCGMWRVVGRWAPRDPFVEKMHHTVVLCWGCVVGIALLLGTLGVLSATALLGAVTTVALVALWSRDLGGDCNRPSEHKTDDTPIDSAGEAEAFAAHGTRERSLARGPARCPRLEVICWFGWCAWAALCLGRLVVSGLLEYPSNWDTLTYHLPFVDSWLSSGSLYVPGATKWFFPGNNELLALWMVAPFSGDFFGPLNNVPSITLLLLTALQLARLCGVATLTRHLGVLAIVSNYVIWHQLMDNKNDVAVVSLFFASLVYALRYAKDARTPDLLLGSICLGLLGGVKYYAVAYMGIALLAMVALTAYSQGLRRAVAALAVCGLAVSVWAGYWYVRNMCVTGSPFYPMSFFASQGADTGARPDFASTTLWGNNNLQRFPLWLDALWRMTGPCHMTCLFVAPWAVLWLFVSGWKLRSIPRGGIEPYFRWTLATVTLASAVVYAVTPFVVETAAGSLDMLRNAYVSIRLGLCFLSLIVLCATVLINDCIPLPACCMAAADEREAPFPGASWAGLHFRGLLSWVWLVLLAIALGYQFLVERRLEDPSFVIDRKLDEHSLPSLAVAGLLLVAACLMAWCWRRQWVRPRALCWWLMGTGAVIMAVAAGLLSARWHSGFAAHYDDFFHTHVFSLLEREGASGTPLCVLSHRSYPFAGSRRQFLVVQAHGTPARPGRFQSRERFLQYLHERGAALLAVEPQKGFWSLLRLDVWSDEHPGAFTTTYQDDAFALLEVNRELLSGAVGTYSVEREAP